MFFLIFSKLRIILRIVIPNDDEGDDGGNMGDGDDIEGNADIADLVKNQIDEEDDIAELVEDGGDIKASDFENPDKAIIEAAIDPDEWYREWQRVAHKLKIKESHDAQEWRSHLDQTKKYADAVQQSLPEVKAKVKLSADEVSRALEKIAKKESMFKTRQDGMSGDYKTQALQMKENTEEYNRLTVHVQELESELYDIEEKLADIKKKMDANQDKISDSSPLIKIKKESQKLKNEIRSIDIRVGVISNTLLQLKLKERNKDDNVKKGAHNEDDEMDMEI